MCIYLYLLLRVRRMSFKRPEYTSRSICRAFSCCPNSPYEFARLLCTASISPDDPPRAIGGAGGFPAYERRHVNALAASFGPKLGLLPEIARVVVRFAFHCGYY